jgi:large subunit ribosomal protein L9
MFYTMFLVKYNYGQERRIMKVIFIKDVQNVAKAGEIKEVANGYGRNYLIPKKLAVTADTEAINIVEAKIASQARTEAKTEAEMLEAAKQIEGREIFIQARSGGKEKLYGSITNADIASELEKVTGIIIDKRKIKLDEPINQIGSYDIVVRFTKDITPAFKVTIIEKKE